VIKHVTNRKHPLEELLGIETQEKPRINLDDLLSRKPAHVEEEGKADPLTELLRPSSERKQ